MGSDAEDATNTLSNKIFLIGLAISSLFQCSGHATKVNDNDSLGWTSKSPNPAELRRLRVVDLGTRT